MESNRFSPPATAVADVAPDGGYQPIRWWPPSGRIGRLRFLAYGVAIYLVFVLASFVFGALATAFARGSMLLTVIGVIGFVIYLVAEALILIQRSHDMDLSGWWSIAAMIPLVGLFWVFKGGSRGVNRWGAPPPPNGWGVRVLGAILPIVLVLGIVAAVALPAYQQYVLRAKAGGPR
jgi:uncharacterized membrane protein YhaH (DUF805 family)